MSTRTPRTPRTLLLLAAPLALIALAACGDDSNSSADTSASSGPIDVAGNAYVATSATGITLPEGSTLRIEFSDTDINVSGGCNTMNSTYSIEGDVLTVAPMMSTQMACDEALMTLDTDVSTLLSSSPTLAVVGDTLTITSGDTSLTMSVEADLPLVGTAWTVTAIVDANAVSSYSIEPTLLFTETTVEVFAGCNTGSGTVTITDTTIEFDPIAMTMKACEGDASTVEGGVVVVLDGTADYTIEGHTLQITNGENGIQAIGVPAG